MGRAASSNFGSPTRVKPFVAENRQGTWREVGRIEGVKTGVSFYYPIYKNGTNQLYLCTPGGQTPFKSKEELLAFLKKNRCAGRLVLTEGGKEETEIF